MINTQKLLKNNTFLTGLIVLNVFMAVASNIADWDWLMSVPWYLMPFTPICSLYPLTLAIWFVIYARKKAAPSAWFTTFIFIGIVSYGLMSYIYFPTYMMWDGVHWQLYGNMVWVTLYALQAFLIAPHLKPLKPITYTLIIGYFLFKDFTDRYWGTFIDLTRPDFPEHLKDFLGICMLIIHAGAIAFMFKVSYANAHQSSNEAAKNSLPAQQNP